MKVQKRIYTTNEHMGMQGGKKPELENVTVIGQYQHHVLVENDRGKRYCITNAEIFQMIFGRMYGHRTKVVQYNWKGRRMCA